MIDDGTGEVRQGEALLLLGEALLPGLATGEYPSSNGLTNRHFGVEVMPGSDLILIEL